MVGKQANTLKLADMTLDEAGQLAIGINADKRFIVIAIGRFLMMDELVAPGADDRPWGITVMPRDKPERRATLWNPEQWNVYCDLITEELELAKQPKRRTSPPPEPATCGSSVKASPTEDQFLLF